MDRSLTPPPRVPGAWVDSPPLFNRQPLELPSPPSRGALMPSEPKEPTMDPRRAEHSEFYHDLIRGFSDMVLSAYRQEYLPKLKPEEGRPGMFVLKKGPSKEFLRSEIFDVIEKRDWLTEEVSKNGPFKFDKHDLERPTAVLNVDFCVSACSDYVSPPPAPKRKIALPISLINRPRIYSGPPPLHPSDASRNRIPSPPPREPSPESNAAFLRPPQEELHAGHQCFDVERLAREFMWWFVEWRAAIPRHIDGNLDPAIEATVHNYTRRVGYGWTRRLDELEYKQALYNLIWELKHPRASRFGQTNPNGTRLQHPWMLGDELIHTVLGLSKAHMSTIELKIKTMMRFSYTMRTDRRHRAPLANLRLWGMLTRPAAPFDDSVTRNDDFMRYSNGKHLQSTEKERYEKERKRRLMWDGSAEVQEPDTLDENVNKENGGLSDEERKKLIRELEDLKAENQGLRKSRDSANLAASEAKDEVADLRSELEAERRTQSWVVDQGNSRDEPESSEHADQFEDVNMMDIDG